MTSPNEAAQDPEARLGGRLALLDRADLSPAQAALWERMDATMGGGWAEKLRFRAKTADGRYVGPFNPMLSSPTVAQAFLQLQLDEARHTALPERVRQVVILAVGAVWKSSYELYAHSAAARGAGFSGDCVAALAAGAPHPELSAAEETARRLTLALAARHVVDDALYAEALACFGQTGLVDLAVLAGCYGLVCGLLNLFAVPAP